MNQEKIGKFISTLRKEKKLTQEQLAEKIGVTNKSISRWENGKTMPDLSLLEPLSNLLGITINELISGEKIKEEKVIPTLEKSLINTIDYSNQKIKSEHKRVSILFMAIGSIISILAFAIFNRESSWCSIYSLIGIILFIIGISRQLKIKKMFDKVIISTLLFLSIFLMFNLIDFIGILNFKHPPLYSYRIKTELRETKMVSYYSLFCNVYRINADTKNEYYLVDYKKEYDCQTIPISPFNRNKSGIDNILKYQNKYVGNNSNDGNLIENLPLSEYGYAFKIDSNNLGLIIYYHTTDWYDNENLYSKKSLIYNSVEIFSLIDNVTYIEYHFSGNSYQISRKEVEEKYPNYSEIMDEKTILKDNFNQYVEQKINDFNFTNDIFKILFEQK